MIKECYGRRAAPRSIQQPHVTEKLFIALTKGKQKLYGQVVHWIQKQNKKCVGEAHFK